VGESWKHYFLNPYAEGKSVSYAPWLILLLIFTRIVTLFFVVPFFNRRGIPVFVRIAFSFLLAYLLYLTVGGQGYLQEGSIFFPHLFKEVLVGLGLGYLVLLYFVLFQTAGQLIDYKSGLMLSGVFEPQFGSQVTFLGNFYYLLALTFYLGINGHHYLLYSLAESFRLIPFAAPLRTNLALNFTEVFVKMFRIAFQISAPVIITLFVADLALGFIARTVPQFHVFMEGLPLKVVLSLTIVALVLPLMGEVFADIFTVLQEELEMLLWGWLNHG
jgi:flagellar biosynthetic protein FliR